MCVAPFTEPVWMRESIMFVMFIVAKEVSLNSWFVQGKERSIMECFMLRIVAVVMAGDAEEGRMMCISSWD